VQQRLVVAVQIEHDVGVDRHPKQRLFQHLRCVLRLPPFDGGACRRTDRGHVRGRIQPEPAGQRIFQFVGDVAEGAVEIGTGAEVEAPEWRAVHDLRQPDRIRGGYQDHFAADASLAIEPFEFAPQDVRDEHRGHLVRVQRCLDIDLAAAARAAVVVRRELVTGDARFGRDRMGLRMHADVSPGGGSAADYV